MTGDVPVLQKLRQLAGRGKRLSMSKLDADGNIEESEDDLIAAAGKILSEVIDPNAYHLARMADSEHPTAEPREKAAMMNVMLNDARAHGWSLFYTMTVGKGYGRQSGRRCSTARDPYETTYRIAQAVLAGEVADETRGATKFVHRTGFASLLAYQKLVNRWHDAHSIVPVALEGIHSFRIFLPKSQYQEEQVLPEVV